MDAGRPCRVAVAGRKPHPDYPSALQQPRAHGVPRPPPSDATRRPSWSTSRSYSRAELSAARSRSRPRGSREEPGDRRRRVDVDRQHRKPGSRGSRRNARRTRAGLELVTSPPYDDLVEKARRESGGAPRGPSPTCVMVAGSPFPGGRALARARRRCVSRCRCPTLSRPTYEESAVDGVRLLEGPRPRLPRFGTPPTRSAAGPRSGTACSRRFGQLGDVLASSAAFPPRRCHVVTAAAWKHSIAG